MRATSVSVFRPRHQKRASSLSLVPHPPDYPVCPEGDAEPTRNWLHLTTLDVSWLTDYGKSAVACLAAKSCTLVPATIAMVQIRMRLRSCCSEAAAALDRQLRTAATDAPGTRRRSRGARDRARVYTALAMLAVAFATVAPS